MKRKIYKFLSSAKQGLFALALVASGTAYSQATYTFNYTGSVQTVTLQAGSYSIQCWGADGGAGDSPAVGGKGGYSSGVYSVVATTTVYVYVGGKGQSNGTSGTAMVTAPGGWNGGGGGFSGSPSTNIKGGGGGGTDVRTTQNTVYANRVIVAGGGGGGSGATNAAYIASGGNGGGTLGQDGVLGTSQTTHNGKGGSQTAGGAGGVYATTSIGVAGSFGLGGDGGSISGNIFPAGGGGGGWYGGGGGATQGGSGGGGSGYIGGVTSGTTIMLSQPGFVPNPTVTGNGMVLIKELCSITLIASTANSLNPSICSGQSVTLTTNAISNYSWTTGATSSSLVVSPTSNTVYGLTATSPSNCTTSSNITVLVSSGAPVLSIATSTNITCLGKTVTLTASGAITYTWTNGVVNGASYSPSVTNTYTVTGQNGCGITTAFASVTVAPLQVNAISSPTIVCAGSPSTLSAVAAATSFTWYANSPTTSSIVVNPTTTTIYTVTVSDGTCAGVTTVSLAVNPIPTIGIVASSSVVCAGSPVTLTATGGINYTWTPALPSVSTVTANPAGPTLYSVIGDNSFSCTSGANQVVLTNPSPTVNVVPSNTFICLGDAITLMASGTATSYVWVNGPSSPSFTVNPISSIVYTVVGTGGANNNNCSTTKTATVNVFSPILTIAVAPSPTVCAGTSVTLTASGTDDFNWENGPPLSENNVTPSSTTIYTVSGNTATLNLICSATQTVQIMVNPNPTVTATSNRTVICKGEKTTLNASGAPSFSWSTGALTSAATVSSNIANILTYTVTGTDANNCKNMATIQVKVNSCTGITTNELANEQLLVFPNPSTGEFFIQSDKAVTVELLNELGQKITTIKLEESNGYKTKVSGISSGIYFLSGNKNEGKVYQKIVVN